MKVKILMALPFLVLLGWVAYLQMSVMNAQTIVMPVSGYDPRDLLSGNYLRLRINYPTAQKRSGKGTYKYFCINEQKFFAVADSVPPCKLFIYGGNQYWFNDGIERFYVPEKHARDLEKLLQNEKIKGKIVLAVPKNGRAIVTDLLFDGKSWREYITP